LKPSNIILPDDSSQPKIVDFAVRRIVAALGDEGFATDTPYGPVYGNVAYLAPEQIKGEQADERTDVYCLGLVMYEMLTGARPYGVDSPADMARAHVEASAESMRAFKPHLKIPKFIDKAVMRALEKDPGRRQAGAAELSDELQGEIIPEKERPLARARRPRPAPKAPEKKAAAPAAPAKAAPEGAAAKAAAVTGPRLVLYKGKNISAVFPLDKPKMLVGRSPECDIFIDDQAVSRVHARISQKADRIIVEDLDSLNGTYINKDAVRRGHIEHKDNVIFGSVVLVFRTD
ncbi:MAG: FHA domain-containing protein, partial [Planctomycetes bacterium]|nr:FHA domain-containing protein [Planctomycetota bacterium]